jgi:putative transposase
MSIPGQHHSVVGTYFVTSRTWQSRPLFVTDSMCSIFIDSLLHYRDEDSFSLHAFVVMPDHFHALLTPATDKTLERVVQYIKGGSARRLAIEKNMHFPVWQRGFSDHRIRDEADFATHVRYIDENPIRRKLVAEPHEYRWCSASRAYSLDQPPQGLKPQFEEVALRHG